MRQSQKMFSSLVLLAGMLVPGVNASAQTSGGQAEASLAQRVGKKLLSIPDYAVFDSIGFALQGSTVVLEGYASRPILKSEAEKVLQGMEGVGSIQNHIKVLPLSSLDDRIRIEVFRRVYGYPSLRKYSNGAPLENSLAVQAGGITNDPPLGFHAIHIIVDNGHVTLTGVVDSKSDADVAYIQANSAPGAFSVKNDLNYPGRKPAEIISH